ncbi:Transglycosylase SLT domain protein [Candidatus Anstonella stagnisolia]|nr:Transglycosylase SLT domain protein [Candidatus Anstonella stagnisolia]
MALSQLPQKFADAPKTISGLGEICVATYKDEKSGKTYGQRLLVKNADGEFYDYRMFSNPKNEKAWLSAEEWWNKVGLDKRKYSVEIKSLSESGISIAKVDAGTAAAGQKNIERVQTGIDGMRITDLRYKCGIFRDLYRQENGYADLLGRAKAIIENVNQYVQMYNGVREQKITVADSLAVIATESLIDPNAKSPTGCKNYGQFSTQTADSLRDPDGNRIFTERKVGKRGLTLKDIWDPEKAVHATVNYFTELYDMYGGNYGKAVKAYNIGPGKVRKKGNTGETDHTRRAREWRRFFKEINVERLLEPGMTVEKFMQQPEFANVYARLEQQYKRA